MKSTLRRARAALFAALIAASGSAIAATAAVTTFFYSDEAEAGCCYAYNDGIIYGYIAAAKAAIKAHFTVQQLAVIATLQQHAGQITGNLKEQMAADARMRTVQDHREVQRRIEDVKVKALLENQPSPSACNVITGSARSSGLDRHSKTIQEDVSFALGAIDSGKEGTKKGRTAILSDRIDSHCSLWATPDEVVEGGVCEGFPVSEYANADLNVSTIFSARNGVLSDDQAAASTQFIVTAFSPTPLGNLGITNSRQVNEDYLVRRKASIARASIATEVGGRIHADRVRYYSGTENGDELLETAEALARQVAGYDSEGNNFPNGISAAAWDELRAKSWHFNNNWQFEVGSRGLEGDIALMTGYSIYQTWKTNQRLDEISITLAAILANMEERDRRVLIGQE